MEDNLYSNEPKILKHMNYPAGAKNDSDAPYNRKDIGVTFCIFCGSPDIDSETGTHTCLECASVFTDLEYDEHVLDTLKSDAEERKFEEKRDLGME